VNRAEAPRTIRLHMTGGPGLNLNRYVFSSTSAKTDKNGFAVALEKLPCNIGAGITLSCEANSVVILSSSSDDLHNQPAAADGR
jgi:hypothetical protein